MKEKDMSTTHKGQLVRLMSNGRTVVARPNRDYIGAITYANRKQAYAKQAQLGDEWEVIHPHRAFLVALKEIS